MDRHRARLTWLLAALPLAFLAVFFAWPVAMIVLRGLGPGSLDAFESARTWKIIGFTAGQAVLSTILTIVVALPAAYALHRVRFPLRRLLIVVCTVPFVLPTVVVGLAFRALLPAGMVGGLGAILLAHVFFNVAVVIRIVGSLWAHIDRRYEHTASTLGARPLQVLRTVAWPLLRPAVIASAVLVFLFTFTSFGVVLILGGPTTTTIEVEIYRRTAQQLDLAAAAGLTLMQLVVLVVVLAVSARLQQRLSVTQRLMAAPVAEPPRTPTQWAAVAWTFALSAAVAAPLLALVARSFRVGEGWGLDWWSASATLGAGTTRYAPPLEALRTSLAVAVVATLLSVALGGLAACAIAYSSGGARLLDAGLMIPLGTSAVTVGFGLLITFDRWPVDLRGSWIIIPVAHALIAIPLVVRAVLPVARSVDPRLRSVAATLGARPVRAWWDIDRPMLMRALGVGAGFAFAVSLGEFGATAFLARADTPTLPVQIVRLLGRPGEQSIGVAMVLATILMAVTAVALIATDRFRAGRPGEI